MKFSIAIFKNENQFEHKIFALDNEVDSKLYDVEELSNVKVDLILYSKEITSDDFISLLSEEYKISSVRAYEDIKLSESELAAMGFETAYTVFKKCQESWILQNNLDLLESLFPTLNHLKELWPNDRTSFMEELWFLLRANLGALDMKIIYNSLKKGEKENEKNKLIQSRVAGTRYPETYEGGDFEKAVIENYKADIVTNFEITDYDEDKGELVATVNLNGSPVVIMAVTPFYSRVTNSLLSTLFDGLQLS